MTCQTWSAKLDKKKSKTYFHHNTAKNGFWPLS